MGLDIDAKDNLYVQIARAAGTYHVLVYDLDGNKNGDEIDIPGTQSTVGYILEIVTTGQLLVGPSPAILSFSGPAPFTGRWLDSCLLTILCSNPYTNAFSPL